MSHSRSPLPPVYYAIFGVLEPIVTLIGFIGALIDPTKARISFTTSQSQKHTFDFSFLFLFPGRWIFFRPTICRHRGLPTFLHRNSCPSRQGSPSCNSPMYAVFSASSISFSFAQRAGISRLNRYCRRRSSQVYSRRSSSVTCSTLRSRYGLSVTYGGVSRSGQWWSG